MKKLGIYVLYDKDGIVDRYVLYFLDKIRPYLDKLIIVINGILNDVGKVELTRYADDIVIRRNVGYDAMAVRSVLVDYYGWTGLYEFDRVVVMNDTFFGPFHSMSNIFAEIEGGADLYGTLVQIAGETEKSRIMKLCSFFYSMSKKLLQCESWRKFWVDMEGDRWSFGEVLDNYENRLILECEKAECIWDAYLRSDKIRCNRKESSYAHYQYLAYELIRYYQYPFMKRKTISWKPNYSCCDSGTLKRALEYIEDKTDYDVSMIWENILRLYSICDIKNSLQLTRIYGNREEGIIKKEISSSAAVILKTEQKDWLDDYIYYITIGMECPIFVFTDNDFIFENFKSKLLKSHPNVQVEYGIPVQKYIEIILDISQKYKVVLYIDDSNMVYKGSQIVAGRNVQNMIHECMWKRTDYLCLIEDEFKKHKFLGVGIMPQMYHDKYMSAFKNDWGEYMDDICRAVALINPHIILNEQVECINKWPVFWTRGTILEKACDVILANVKRYSYKEIACIMGRLVPYVAQALGFYTEEFLEIRSAEIYYSNLEYLVRELLERYAHNGNVINEYIDFNYIGMKEFCSGKTYIYIYGAGVWGRRVLEKLENMEIRNIKGFIVSDGYKEVDMLGEYHVYELSKINISTDTGIIVATRESQKIIIENKLKNRGVENIFTI